MRALTRAPLIIFCALLALAIMSLALFTLLRSPTAYPAPLPTVGVTAPALTRTPAAAATSASVAPRPSPSPTAALTQPMYQFTDDTVRVSVDGQNWQDRPKRFEDRIVSLLSSVTNPEVVYVLTVAPLTTTEQFRPRLRYTLYASTDAAVTWSSRASDEIGGCYVVKVSLRALRGATVPPEMLSLSTQCADNPSDSRGFGMGARLSTDGGRSFIWSLAADGIDMIYTHEGILRFIPDRSGGAGLALSIDKGLTWQALTPPDLNVGYPTSYPVFEADEGNPAHVRLRERIGEQRAWDSYDGGHTWTR